MLGSSSAPLEALGTFGPFRTFETVSRNLPPQTVHLSLRGELRQMIFQPPYQIDPRHIITVLTETGGDRFFKIRAVDAIRIDQATEEYPREQAPLKRLNHLVAVLLAHALACVREFQNQLWISQQCFDAFSDDRISVAPCFRAVRVGVGLVQPSAEIVAPVRLHAVDQPRMVRRDAQSKELGSVPCLAGT